MRHWSSRVKPSFLDERAVVNWCAKKLLLDSCRYCNNFLFLFHDAQTMGRMCVAVPRGFEGRQFKASSFPHEHLRGNARVE